MTNDELKKEIDLLKNEIELQDKLLGDLGDRLSVAERRIRRLKTS